MFDKNRDKSSWILFGTDLRPKTFVEIIQEIDEIITKEKSEQEKIMPAEDQYAKCSDLGVDYNVKIVDYKEHKEEAAQILIEHGFSKLLVKEYLASEKAVILCDNKMQAYKLAKALREKLIYAYMVRMKRYYE